jgi:hypothetical protein
MLIAIVGCCFERCMSSKQIILYPDNGQVLILPSDKPILEKELEQINKRIDAIENRIGDKK